MPENSKIGVIGGGSWATALVILLTKNLEKVSWWIRNPENIDYIRKFQHNPHYLRTAELKTDRLQLSADLSKIVADCDVLVLAVPSAFVDATLATLPEGALKGKKIFSAVKGIIPENNMIPADYFNTKYNIPFSDIGIICGPCHAEEIAMEKLSYLTVGCQNEEHAKFMADLLTCRFVKATVTEDIFGTEYSAVLKNVVAIASGICHGLGYGDNFQAVLLSNAIQEIERFVDAVSPVHRDVKSSSYLGDLLVTSYSQFSRNRMFGNMIGKGYSVKSAMIEMAMIAEGYYAVKCVQEINKEIGVEMPITNAVYNVLYEKIAPAIEMRLLTDQLT